MSSKNWITNNSLAENDDDDDGWMTCCNIVLKGGVAGNSKLSSVNIWSEKK